MGNLTKQDLNVFIKVTLADIVKISTLENKSFIGKIKISIR
jgi:hypothetical protein